MWFAFCFRERMQRLSNVSCEAINTSAESPSGEPTRGQSVDSQMPFTNFLSGKPLRLQQTRRRHSGGKSAGGMNHAV